MKALDDGNMIMLICNMIIVGFFFLAAVVNANASTFLKRGSILGTLMYKRVGKPAPGWMDKDLLFIGPINEFLSMSVVEVIAFLIVLAWLGIAVWARYYDLIYNEALYVIPHGIYDIQAKRYAFGRAMSQATLRLLLLAMVSSNRNTVFLHFLGIPFERALTWHKRFGRLQLVCIYVHVVTMLIAGTQFGYTQVTGN